MTLAEMARGHAREIRARLWRPPNAVHDRGIDLGGKDIHRALEEIANRNQIEKAQEADEDRRRLQKKETAR